ncbi:MAG: hypothetical protein ACPG4Y_06775 [Chitinophagales bacterium]
MKLFYSILTLIILLSVQSCSKNKTYICSFNAASGDFNIYISNESVRSCPPAQFGGCTTKDLGNKTKEEWIKETENSGYNCKIYRY